MRYHWGLGVGHLHAHRPDSTSKICIPDEARDTEFEADQYTDLERSQAHSPDAVGDIEMYESDNPELGLEDRDFEGWQDVETLGSSSNDLASEHESESEPEDGFHS
jgi:hypothetical protein